MTQRLRASDLAITEDEMTVTLSDGRKLSVSLVRFPKLLHASETERITWQWIGDGEGVRWPLLDEDLSIAGFLRAEGLARADAMTEEDIQRAIASDPDTFTVDDWNSADLVIPKRRRRSQ